nr:hypothetical protein BgiMline_020494 [Biomphalaria glabrata]
MSMGITTIVSVYGTESVTPVVMSGIQAQLSEEFAKLQACGSLELIKNCLKPELNVDKMNLNEGPDIVCKNPQPWLDIVDCAFVHLLNCLKANSSVLTFLPERSNWENALQIVCQYQNKMELLFCMTNMPMNSLLNCFTKMNVSSDHPQDLKSIFCSGREAVQTCLPDLKGQCPEAAFSTLTKTYDKIFDPKKCETSTSEDPNNAGSCLPWLISSVVPFGIMLALHQFF